MLNPELVQHLYRSRVLIIEDDDELRARLLTHFARNGFKRLEAVSTGKDALQEIHAAASSDDPFDLIILDLALPGNLTGQAVYHGLSLVLDVPIVVISFTDDRAAQIDALKHLEVEEFFVKPLDMELFALKCERILMRRVYARQLAHQAQRNHRLFLNVLQVMAKVLEAKDPYTGFHSESVAKYARQIARRYGFNAKSLERIQIAGILHDFGKIGISDVVLNKPGKLTDSEYRAVQRHPLIASTLLEPLEELRAIITDIRHHHERWDGRGYPYGLKGEAIPLGARILGVADAYDAMTSSRSYHEARSEPDAHEELQRCSGSQFDPGVVRSFLGILEENTERNDRIVRLREKVV
ncbi:MAG: HD domain-containing phosphohydrolase [Planctomycetota bacterium]